MTPKQKKKGKNNRITNAEALKRLDSMSPILFKNIDSALRIEATMIVGNDIVGEMLDRNIPGASAFNCIMHSLACDLAMHLARLFDSGARRIHANKRDVASIPLAIRLLRQQRNKKALAARARKWKHPDTYYSEIFEQDCLNAIQRALDNHSNTFRGQYGKGGLMILKEFRDKFMAHSLITDSTANPIFHHLYRLTDSARDTVKEIRLAVEGRADDLEAHERIFTENAESFWRRALLGENDEN